eukprot:6192621-Amphidinium_carterae.1
MADRTCMHTAARAWMRTVKLPAHILRQSVPQDGDDDDDEGDGADDEDPSQDAQGHVRISVEAPS